MLSVGNLLRYTCAKKVIKIQLALTKLLQKQNGAVFFDSHDKAQAPLNLRTLWRYINQFLTFNI